MWVRFRPLVTVLLASFALGGPIASRQAHARPATDAIVEVRRTTDGIPHIRAADWQGAGFGMGYVQAQDALCTLAEAFVTYEGRRSYFFGPEGKPRNNATFGRASNLELDIFFRGFVDNVAVEKLKAQQPQELIDMVAGFADGYNRFLDDRKTRHAAGSPRTCLSAEWVRPITADDLFRRLYAAGLAAGYARFIPEIVNAQPPDGRGLLSSMSPGSSLHQAWTIGEREGIGSNMIAFGHAAGGDGSALFGNPHWFWGGPDRLYQAHLTIPGRLNVAGASFLGVPVIMIGFNNDVAWSHTVSNAKRFGLYALELDSSDPRSYRVDGTVRRMEAQTVAVPVRGRSGEPSTVERTLYRTRFGPLVDLSNKASALGWTRATAVAIRDVNADNHRVFRNFLYWNRAHSLEEFVAIQRRELGMPWVNTVAIGRDDRRAWYADMGAVPNVPDTLRTACRTAMGAAFESLDAKTPFLDGTRSDCDWEVDPSAAQAGAMPADRLPGLFRRDYVANMNDSYWLANPYQPLEGYAKVLGGEREALSLRGRHGHAIAAEVMREGQGSSTALVRSLKRETLRALAYSADRFMPSLLSGACAQPHVRVDSDPLDNRPSDSPRYVDVRQACGVLARWTRTAGPRDRGAQLWNAFWERLEKIPQNEFHGSPFVATDPLRTPDAPRQADPRVAQALAAAVLSFASQGRSLDEPVRQRLYVHTAGTRLALYGGCGAGYFTIACADGAEMDGRAHGNSYLQIVRFGKSGVEADTLLAHGLDESAVEGGEGSAPVRRYARKQWLRMPFTEREISENLVLQLKIARR
jgi:acyl-homoserine-lactone acylase